MALNFPSNPSENDIYQFGLLTYVFKKGKWVSQSRGASQLPWYSNMEQARALWKRLAAEAGLNLVDGSFEEGAEITSSSDVVWWQAGSAIYGWHLNEAKTVPVGSTPATSGGIGAGAWVDRTDVTLRSELSEVLIIPHATGAYETVGGKITRVWGRWTADTLAAEIDIHITWPVTIPAGEYRFIASGGINADDLDATTNMRQAQTLVNCGKPNSEGVDLTVFSLTQTGFRRFVDWELLIS